MSIVDERLEDILTLDDARPDRPGISHVFEEICVLFDTRYIEGFH